MKPKITEENAAAMVMNGIFQQCDNSWEGMWQILTKMSLKNKTNLPSKDFVKTNFSLAAIALNFRIAFDVFPHERAERMLEFTFNLLQRNLGDKNSDTVQKVILKYFEAYNAGLLEMRNPITDVAMLLYYKIGMSNTEQKLVDESYYVPDPKTVEYLANALAMFAGKWNIIQQKFEIVTGSSSGRTKDNEEMVKEDDPGKR